MATKLRFSEIGDNGVRYLFTMGGRNPVRYFGAADRIVTYGNTSFAEVIQRLDAEGGLYQFDPASYTNQTVIAALEQYGDDRQAELAAKAAKRKARA